MPDHVGHEHAGHEHAGHEHVGHEHVGHEHVGHEHVGHEHAGHEHVGRVGVRIAVPVAVTMSSAERDDAVRQARGLNRATIGWNSVEGVIAVAAGAAAGSVSLVGFGFDSAIEVSAALILMWRLRQERRAGCTQGSDRVATRAIALSFAALAVYVGIESTRDLVAGSRPEESIVGIALASASLLVMPILARAKRDLAPALGSAAVIADAKQTNLCALLSAVLLVGLGANAVLGWWWADPLAGLGIAALAAVEAVRTWRAESLEDTCCA